MKFGWVARWSILWLLVFSQDALGQGSLSQSDTDLEGVTGRERLERLVDLVRTLSDREPVRALALGAEAQELLHEFEDPALELQLLNTMAFALNGISDFRAAEKLASRALLIARDSGEPVAEALALQILGRAHRSLGELPLALEEFQSSIRLLETLQEPQRLADAYNHLGITHWVRNDYVAALDALIQSLEFYRLLDDEGRVASALNNIGITHRMSGQPESALGYYQQALEIREREGNLRALSNVLNNIGNVHLDLGDPAAALGYFESSLELGGLTPKGHANTIHNTGVAHRRLGDLNKAKDFYATAAELREELGDQEGLVKTRTALASVQRDRGQIEGAFETLTQALDDAQGLDSPESLRQLYRELSRIHEQADRPADALAAFKEYDRLEGEIFNAEMSQNLARMQARFEADQKEHQIRLLEEQQEINRLEAARQRTIRHGLMITLALFLFCGVLLFNHYRLEIKHRELSHRAEENAAELKILRGLLPICGICKRIREDDRWSDIETYIGSHSEAKFSHGLCPECATQTYPEFFVDE